MRFRFIFLLLFLGFVNTGFSVNAEVVTTIVNYTHNGTELQGYLAYEETYETPRPGVLVVHQWKGLGDYERRRARQLADIGYVAFAADIYGADTRPSTNHEAALASKTFRENRHLYRKRLRAALNQLQNRKRVNTNNLAAIGYCFGGTGVLELARSGADVDGVVSFHGGLSNPNPEDAQNIKAAIQVHHGAHDPHVSQDAVLDFWNEMKDTDIEWDLNVYSNAYHSFTEKHAGSDPSGGSAYNARADRVSWHRMKSFFRTVFDSVPEE